MKKQALFFHLNAYLLLYFSINGHREILLGKAVMKIQVKVQHLSSSSGFPKLYNGLYYSLCTSNCGPLSLYLTPHIKWVSPSHITPL